MKFQRGKKCQLAKSIKHGQSKLEYKNILQPSRSYTYFKICSILYWVMKNNMKITKCMHKLTGTIIFDILPHFLLQ